jgi:diguanylate cyclase (GGDEF)-like protein/PAS domain S-box-containing protein
VQKTLKKSESKQPRQSAKARLQKNTSPADTQKLLSELQVRQVELEMQNDELREARDDKDAALYRFTELFDFAPVAYFAIDRNSLITQVNLKGASLLKLERCNVIGRLFIDYTTLEYRLTFNDFLAKVFDTNDNQHCELLVHVDEHILWLSLEANTGLAMTECLVAVIDITARKRAEAKLKRAASVFSHTHQGIMITDVAGTITEVNETFTRITGYTAKEVLGENPRILKSGRQSQAFYAEMWHSISTEGHWYGEIWNRRKNGEIYSEILTISAVENAAGLVQHYVSLSTDITQIKDDQGRLERSVHFDALTHLPNRVLLSDRLSQAMVKCQRSNGSLAVAFIDLDGFKAINDNYGHNIGDELLVVLSKRMKEALREEDTLARIGGNEFIAVMVDLEKIEDSEPVLQRLLKSAADPVVLADTSMQVSASIGVTHYPQDGADAEQLMRHADQAMYSAKQAGKNRYHLFDTAKDRAVKTQRQSIGDVRSALQRSEFVLHYQPKVNMRTGAVIGVEALIRWQHPVRGMLLPLDCLPVIEDHEISLKLGEWVINTALSQRCLWLSAGIALPISVNISAYQLQQDNFATRLALLLAAHPQVDPRCLELEILETSALSDIGKVSATMDACHKLGVRFAFDDFGTGYSSLTYLKRLPAYLIKIDQSFVRDMLLDADDLVIIEGIVGLAKAFKREVLAEGVETVAHGVALLQLGCELGQGYGIARPMPAAEIPKWISNWQVDASWQAVNVP